MHLMPTRSELRLASIDHAYDGMMPKESYVDEAKALDFRAGAKWMAAQMLRLNQKPVKAKGEASAAIPEWVRNAALELTTEWKTSQISWLTTAEVILKHAPKHEPLPDWCIETDKISLNQRLENMRRTITIYQEKLAAIQAAMRLPNP